MFWISGAVPAVLVLGANNNAAKVNSVMAADGHFCFFGDCVAKVKTLIS
jgi:hypothetical protein